MPNYERARGAVRKLVKEKGKVDKTELALGIADAAAGWADGALGLGGLGSFSGLSGAAGLLKAMSEDDATVMPNINFVYNGHEDGDSPVTAAYFKGRGL